jgi:hypothetical protein
MSPRYMSPEVKKQLPRWLALTPKDVADILGLSIRSACRLMATGHIVSCRVGPGGRLLRTELAHVEDYRRRQLAKAA